MRSSHSSWLSGSHLSCNGLSSLEVTSLGHELIHGEDWLDSGLVDNWLLVDDLVHWDGGVDDFLLDGLPLDDWLDSLVDVVVSHILTNCSNGRGLLLSWQNSLRVLVCVLLSSKSLLGTLTHLVGLLSVLYGEGVVLVDLWGDLSVGDRLYSLLVVVNMATQLDPDARKTCVKCLLFSVLNDLGLLSDVLLDSLLDDGWSDSLVGLSGSNSVLAEDLSCSSWDR